ncbi:DoxX family protein [Calidifontibacillus erzurumensis]|uniref:DoxX family protein n=1 Tax=Calidifontibacillus erzurumensis TaxID=2741433 RepID=A0A8J8GI05_9BACI|nr:DoxX family protein [Calidifontibacillus erzurumensis]NSL52138.1 DoxX family protein [Calidifontibacillus erzurumensis]
MKWMKGPIMSGVWTIVRIWLGIQWIEAGWHKVVDGFDASGFIQGAIGKAAGDHPAVSSWYAAFLENVALPNSGLFSFLVAWGELLVGIGLIIGCLTIPALLAGAFMNLNFLLAGTTSTNPVLYTVAIILLAAGSASYYYGVDRFLVPYMKEKFGKKRMKEETEGHATV